MLSKTRSKSNAPGGRFLRLVAAMTASCIAMVGVGCTQLNNPWQDSATAMDAEMTTPSAQGYQGKTEFGRPSRRTTAQAVLYYENGVTTHWPLWFEDPFEDKGNRWRNAGEPDDADVEFALNWVDYLYLAYGPARLFVNTVTWPIGAVVTPPGMLLESDGRVSKGLVWYDHDARRSDSADREPPDQALVRFHPPALEE